jgi:hypothetical protein
MAIFDQRGQRVTYQYNAAGDIHFGAMQNRMDLVGELGKLQRELTQARQAGVFDEGWPPTRSISSPKPCRRPRNPHRTKRRFSGISVVPKPWWKGWRRPGAWSPHSRRRWNWCSSSSNRDWLFPLVVRRAFCHGFL